MTTTVDHTTTSHGTTPYDVSSALDTDCYGVFDDLTPDERAIWARTRAYVDTEVLPVINDYWERAEHPAALLKGLAALDVTGEGVDYPGMPVMSRTASGLVAMELNRGDGSIGTQVGVQSHLVMRSIGFLGSPEQKARWLPALARWDALGAFALTEPTHGSDSVSLSTEARRDGNHYVLNGTKRWIGNGSIADVLVVWARGEDGRVGGYLVEGGTTGLTARNITGKASLRAVWQADLTLTDVRVPLDAKLPGCRSFRDVAAVLTTTRAGVAWAALGHALAAYESALAYSGQRTQFGQPLASFQIVQDRLVRMLAELTSMQLHCRRIGRLDELGQLTETHVSLAKLHNTRKARQVISDARDLLGGNGILLENHVMRHLADIEALHTYEGTETIQTLIVGRAITGIGAFA